MTRFASALVLALAMAAGIALELAPAFGDREEPPPAASTILPIVPGQTRAAGVPERQAATALSRPLFRPGRRPYAPDAPDAPSGTETARAPRLAGIVLTPTNKAAIFAADGSRPTVRSEGGRIGPFEVLLIEAGRVTLAGPAGLQVLHPAAMAELALPSWPDRPTIQRLLDDAQAMR